MIMFADDRGGDRGAGPRTPSPGGGADSIPRSLLDECRERTRMAERIVRRMERPVGDRAPDPDDVEGLVWAIRAIEGERTDRP